MKMSLAQRVEEIVLPLTDSNDFELVDVEYVKEAGVYFLRVIIDRQEGVGHEDCEKISRELSPILDEKDFIEENYFLEVCSPGIDRVLKKDHEFEKYSGRDVEVKLYKVNDEINSKHFEATLSKLNESGEVVLIYEGRELKIIRKDIAQIRLAVSF